MMTNPNFICIDKKNAKLINYFKECAGDDFVDIETYDRFMDNPEKKQLGTPERVDAFYGDNVHKKQYSIYIRLKYAYFYYKEIGKSDNEIYELLGINKSLRHLFENVFSYFSADRREQTARAFLLRYNQLDKDAEKFWYNDFIEFKCWSSVIKEKGLTINAPDMGRHAPENFEPIHLERIEYIKNAIMASFNELYSNDNYEKKDYIKSFIKIIEKETQAGLVDYLIVESQGKERTISFYVASDESINKKEEEKPEIRKKEQYMVGEGITGSILVPNTFLPYLHVGTNSINDDIRQSAKHENVYAELYNMNTLNFWVFPLLDENGEIYSAFRVINKAPNANQPYWSYKERGLLCCVATWFQSFWKLMEKMLLSLQSYLSVVDENKFAAKEIIQKLKVDSVVSDEKLSIILSHLTSVVHRKIESSYMRALFVISKDEFTEDLKFNEYPIIISPPYTKQEAINTDFLENLSLSYKVVNPNTAFFLFSTNGYFLGVRQFVEESSNSIDALNTKMRDRDEFIAFYAEGKKKSIRILYKGQLVADYYLSESTGKWQLRFVSDFCKALKKTCVNTNICMPICQIIFDLSFRKIGSILIFTNDPDSLDDNKVNSHMKIKPRSIQSNDSIIRDIASMDGATIITTDGIIKSAGVTLDSSSVLLNEEFTKYINETQKGARHSAGAIFAIENKGACIIVISENKGISILYDGQALVWNDRIIGSIEE